MADTGNREGIVSTNRNVRSSGDVDSETYSCIEYGMAYFVSNKKRAQAIDPISLDRDAVKMLKQAHTLSREYRVQQIAGNSAIITTTINAGGDWDDHTNGTPVHDIMLAMRTISENISGHGIANRIVIPLAVAMELVQTDEYKEYFKYSDSGFSSGLFTVVSGLKNIGLEVAIAGAHGVNISKSSSDPDTESLWDDSVLVFYCEPTPTLQTRTLMYSPYVAKDQIYTTAEPRMRGVYHDIYSDIDELLVDQYCGYLITNTL